MMYISLIITFIFSFFSTSLHVEEINFESIDAAKLEIVSISLNENFNLCDKKDSSNSLNLSPGQKIITIANLASDTKSPMMALHSKDVSINSYETVLMTPETQDETNQHFASIINKFLNEKVDFYIHIFNGKKCEKSILFKVFEANQNCRISEEMLKDCVSRAKNNITINANTLQDLKGFTNIMENIYSKFPQDSKELMAFISNALGNKFSCCIHTNDDYNNPLYLDSLEDTFANKNLIFDKLQSSDQLHFHMLVSDNENMNILLETTTIKKA